MYCNRRRPDSGLPKKNNHSISGVVLKLEGFRGQGWTNRSTIPPSSAKLQLLFETASLCEHKSARITYRPEDSVMPGLTGHLLHKRCSVYYHIFKIFITFALVY